MRAEGDACRGDCPVRAPSRYCPDGIASRSARFSANSFTSPVRGAVASRFESKLGRAGAPSNKELIPTRKPSSLGQHSVTAARPCSSTARFAFVGTDGRKWRDCHFLPEIAATWPSGKFVSGRHHPAAVHASSRDQRRRAISGKNATAARTAKTMAQTAYFQIGTPDGFTRLRLALLYTCHSAGNLDLCFFVTFKSRCLLKRAIIESCLIGVGRTSAFRCFSLYCRLGLAGMPAESELRAPPPRVARLRSLSVADLTNAIHSYRPGCVDGRAPSSDRRKGEGTFPLLNEMFGLVRLTPPDRGAAVTSSPRAGCRRSVHPVRRAELETSFSEKFLFRLPLRKLWIRLSTQRFHQQIFEISTPSLQLMPMIKLTDGAIKAGPAVHHPPSP